MTSPSQRPRTFTGGQTKPLLEAISCFSISVHHVTGTQSQSCTIFLLQRIKVFLEKRGNVCKNSMYNIVICRFVSCTFRNFNKHVSSDETQGSVEPVELEGHLGRNRETHDKRESKREMMQNHQYRLSYPFARRAGTEEGEGYHHVHHRRL